MIKPRHVLGALAGGAILLVALSIRAETDPPKYFVMMVIESSILDNDVTRKAWASYSLSRYSQLVDEFPPPTRAKNFRRDFGREVIARKALAHNYLNIKTRSSGGPSPYLEELAQVYEAGFMSEYVWRFLPDGEWSAGPTLERMAEFEAWLSKTLPNHKPETMVWAEVRREVELIGGRVEFSVPVRWQLSSLDGDKKNEVATLSVPLLGASPSSPHGTVTVSATRSPRVATLADCADQLAKAINKFDSIRDDVNRGASWRTVVGEQSGGTVVEHHVAMLGTVVEYRHQIPGGHSDSSVVDMALAESEQFLFSLAIKNNRFGTRKDLGEPGFFRVEY